MPTTALMICALSLLSVVPVLVTDKLGYTLSLAMFVLPSVALSVSIFRLGPKAWSRIDPRDLAYSLLVLAPMGVTLYFVFASKFFCYPNEQATLDVFAPGLSPAVEEVVFYTFGFVFILLSYARLSIVEDLGEPATRRRPSEVPADTGVNWMVALIFAGLGAVWLATDSDPPGYALYLLLVPGLWVALLWGQVRGRLRWRALLWTTAILVVVSIVWEPLLALPRGWWGYNSQHMLGIFVDEAARLPIEAVVVWLLAPVATAMTYEHIRFWRTAGHLVGRPRLESARSALDRRLPPDAAGRRPDWCRVEETALMPRDMLDAPEQVQRFVEVGQRRVRLDAGQAVVGTWRVSPSAKIRPNRAAEQLRRLAGLMATLSMLGVAAAAGLLPHNPTPPPWRRYSPTPARRSATACHTHSVKAYAISR